MKAIRHIGLMVMASLLFSCTSTQIPRASVELSEIVGEQTTHIQTSHEAFVKLYYDELREDVDVFLREKWIPEFLSRAVDNATFKQAHQNAYRTSTLNPDSVSTQITHLPGPLQTSVLLAVKAQKAELGSVLVGFGEAAVKEIEKQRAKMMGGIDEQEQVVLSHLRQTYADLYRAQSTVEANLRMAADVTEQKAAMLNKLGLLDTQNKLLNKAMRASSLASNALNIAGTGKEGVNDFLKAIGIPLRETPAPPAGISMNQ